MTFALGNPIPWSILVGAALLVWITAALYSRRYPGFPYVCDPQFDEADARSLMQPMADADRPLHWRVPEDAPASLVRELLARGVSESEWRTAAGDSWEW
jgi:hypothetical protein